MKKLISVFLALGLLAGLFTVSAFADATSEDGGVHLYYNGATRDNSTVTSIRKNSSAVLHFEVVDTQVDYSSFYQQEGKQNVEVRYSSNALPLQKGQDVDITIGQTQAGKMRFELEIPVRYTGTGNEVEFTLFYQYFDKADKKSSAAESSEPGSGGEKVLRDRTIHCTHTITACKESSSSTGDDDDENTTPMTPYIIVSNYSYGGSSVTAGQEFTLELTLKNTSVEYDLDNIIMNITPQGVFSVASSSNTLYLESLEKESTVTKTIVIKAGMSKLTDEDDSNSINLRFNFQYMANDQRYNGESTESITLPVDYPDRFELGFLEQGSEAYVGEEYSLYLPMVNKGRSSVYNLTATLEGDMASAGQSLYLGNLNAGTESGADFSVVFNEAGEKSGTIVVTYEDANRNPRTLRQPFSVNVISWEDMYPSEDPGMSEPTDVVDPGMMEEPSGFWTKRNIAIAAGAVLLLAAVIIIRKKRKAESAVGDEEI